MSEIQPIAIIEIRRVEQLPEPERLLSEPISAFQFLLTALLAEQEALLHAEYRGTETEVIWRLRRRSGGPEWCEGADEAIAVLPAGLFRSVVGRLAVTTGIDHTRGGHGKAVLVQDGRQRQAHIFLSNCRATGFWIRVYVHPE